MKKTFLIAVFCALGVTMFAQQTSRRYPPTSVQRSWQRDYPNRNNNEPWEWRNNQWHTRYRDADHSDRTVDVYYDRYGRRIYSQTQWDRSDLPDRVRDRIRSKYRSDNYSVHRIERPGGRFYFQITLGNNRHVYLDSRGRETRNR